jgi:hypothetical protein
MDYTNQNIRHQVSGIRVWKVEQALADDTLAIHGPG